jgi:hypothetical protein
MSSISAVPGAIRLLPVVCAPWCGDGLVVATYISKWADPTLPSARTPGLNPMGLIVEPEPFLLGLASRGFRTENGIRRST